MSWFKLAWRWYDKVDCTCPERAVEELVSYAEGKYNNVAFEYGPGDGSSDNLKEGDVVKDGPYKGLSKVGDKYLYEKNKREIGCYWLVANTLREFDYELFGNSFPEKYFCEIDIRLAKRGDIIAWDNDKGGKSGHAGFVTWNQNSYIQIFSAEDELRDINYLEVSHSYLNSLFCNIRVYRPKECRKVPGLDIFLFPPIVEKWFGVAPRRDPLLLDLDGRGIKTLGHDSEIVFDYDRNGFKELTGWVAQGDGMLMLDRNGNGRLDDGSELLGDFTILPNGTRAANGFLALAYYDANGDGKIDSQDPIWSELKVWQHDTSWGDVHEPDIDWSGWTGTLDELVARDSLHARIKEAQLRRPTPKTEIITESGIVTALNTLEDGGLSKAVEHALDVVIECSKTELL